MKIFPNIIAHSVVLLVCFYTLSFEIHVSAVEVWAESNDKLAPMAVPVLTPEEASDLNEKIKTEWETQAKRGWILYEEVFLSVKDATANIQQTSNWNYIQNHSDSVSCAKKQDNSFAIKSDTPLEYNFVEPLFEHTIYQYTLCCRAKGNGTIVLFQKDKKESKEFLINSKTFETVAFTLGNGQSFNTKIVPAISFQGDLRIEAITIQQKKLSDEKTICSGIIDSISNVPDIEKANYPDCYYTAIFVVKDILDGNPVPQNIQLLIPAFLNNKIDPLSTIIKKGKWKVSIRPFALATKEEQEIEQVDEIDSFLYTPYILVAGTPARIPEYAESGIPVLEGKQYLSSYDNPVNPPLSDLFIESSNSEIEKELEKVNKIIDQAVDIKKINDDFQKAWDEKQKAYDDLDGKLVWAKEQNSFFTLPKQRVLIHPQKMSDENLAALIELDRFLKKQGILFIIQVVPDYYDIAALVLNPEFQKYGDQQSALITQQLVQNGIEAHYLSDIIVQNAFLYEMMFFYPKDFHPGEGTIDIMTSQMAKRLETLSSTFPKTLKEELFRRIPYNTNHTWPSSCNIGTHESGTEYITSYYCYDEKEIVPDPQSKILIFGNSFVTAPTGNGYISYLSSKMLYPLSSKVMRGVSCLSALPILFLQETESLLKNKMVCILPISITYLDSDRFKFSNLYQIDKSLKTSKQKDVVYSLSPKKYARRIFSSSITFTDFGPGFQDYVAEHTNLITLSPDNPEIIIDLPQDNPCNTFSISAQPKWETGVSLLINGSSFRLNSNSLANWEILDVNIKEGEKRITIRIDLENSSKNSVVFIGNITGYK